MTRFVDRDQAIQVARNNGCRSLRAAADVVDAIDALPVVVTDEMVQLACLAYGPKAFPARMSVALKAVLDGAGRC